MALLLNLISDQSWTDFFLTCEEMKKNKKKNRVCLGLAGFNGLLGVISVVMNWRLKRRVLCLGPTSRSSSKCSNTATTHRRFEPVEME